MSEEFEREWTLTRAEAADVLVDLAAGVEDGTVQLGDGEEARTVAVPGEVELEVELERDGDEVELEVELEWPDHDRPGGATGADAGEAGDATVGDTATADEAVPTEEPGPAAPDSPPREEEPGERERTDPDADVSGADQDVEQGGPDPDADTGGRDHDVDVGREVDEGVEEDGESDRDDDAG